MFDDVYSVTKVSVSKALPGEHGNSITLYRFDSKAGDRYLIEVTHFPAGFHTMDFYRKRHRYSRHQFSELTGEGDASRILGTVVGLLARLLREGKDDGVSFGFIGARMPSESSHAVTKRFRVYRMMMEFLISSVDYEHLQNESLDAYVLLNRSVNRQIVLEVARSAFEKEEE